MTARAVERVQVAGARTSEFERVLTEDALGFVARLHREFNPTRETLLRARVDRQRELDTGASPGFLDSTAAIRESDWRVAPAPRDLEDRRVEITGPVERKMMINALNSGASCFMADFEDALAPTWENVIAGTGESASRPSGASLDIRESRGEGIRAQRHDRDAAWCGRADGTCSSVTS